MHVRTFTLWGIIKELDGKTSNTAEMVSENSLGDKTQQRRLTHRAWVTKNKESSIGAKSTWLHICKFTNGVALWLPNSFISSVKKREVIIPYLYSR